MKHFDSSSSYKTAAGLTDDNSKLGQIRKAVDIIKFFDKLLLIDLVDLEKAQRRAVKPTRH